MDAKIDVLGTDEARAMFAEIGRQAPFATALTLNGLANGTQKETREDVRARFRLRRPDFVLNTIFRKPGEDMATKTSLHAAVRVDDRRDFLAKFETGGEKAGTQGHRIAIPIDVRTNKADIITKANRPSAVLKKPRVSLVGSIIRQAVGRGKSLSSKLLYVLKPSVRIPDKLDMREAAQTVTDREFATIAGNAIDRAMASAKPR